MNINSTYSKNLIINLDGEGFANEMENHCLEKRIKENFKKHLGDVEVPANLVTIHQFQDNLRAGISEEDKDVLSKVDAKTRIYLIGHTRPKSNSFGKYHFSHVCEYVAAGIIKENIASKDRCLRISLISCQTAVEGNNGVSLAARIHYVLAQLGLKTEVVARTALVECMSGPLGGSGKLTRTNSWSQTIRNLGYSVSARIHSNDFSWRRTMKERVAKMRHQVPGSKADFIWDDSGCQIRVDSYIRALGGKIKKILNEFPQEEITDFPEVKEIKKLLDRGRELDKETVGEIVGLLRKIANGINEQSPKYMQDFKTNINALLDKANKSISSSSLDTVDLGRSWPQQNSYKSLRQSAQQDFINPLVTAFQSLPETPIKAKLGEVFEEFVLTLTKQVIWQRGRDQTIEKQSYLKDQLLPLLKGMQLGRATREDIDLFCEEAQDAFRNHNRFDKIYHISCGIFEGMTQAPSIMFMPMYVVVKLTMSDNISQHMDDIKGHLHTMLREHKYNKKSEEPFTCDDGNAMKERIYKVVSDSFSVI